MRIIIIILTFVSLFACSDEVVLHTEKTSIIGVYYHEENSFSVATQEGEEIKIKKLSSYWNLHTKIIADVLPNEPMWYSCDVRLKGGSNPTGTGCVIHIHEINDINTSGWDHGKFGKGTTKKIQ